MQVHRHAGDFEERGVRILLITFSVLERVRAWREETGVVGLPILVDSKRDVYRAYGLRRSVLKSWSPATLWYYARAALRGSTIPRSGEDLLHQLGGTFLVDGQGRVRLARASRSPVDRPSIAEILSVSDSLAQAVPADATERIV